jgi:hypothetical protein
MKGDHFMWVKPRVGPILINHLFLCIWKCFLAQKIHLSIERLSWPTTCKLSTISIESLLCFMLGRARVETSFTIWECPHPWALPMLKHDANIFINLKHTHIQGVGGEGFHLLFNSGKNLTCVKVYSHQMIG